MSSKGRAYPANGVLLAAALTHKRINLSNLFADIMRVIQLDSFIDGKKGRLANVKMSRLYKQSQNKMNFFPRTFLMAEGRVKTYEKSSSFTQVYCCFDVRQVIILFSRILWGNIGVKLGFGSCKKA